MRLGSRAGMVRLLPGRELAESGRETLKVMRDLPLQQGMTYAPSLERD